MGAKYPAGTGPTGLVKGTGIDNAHMAFDRLFSQATARTRRYLPDSTRLAPTTAVDPPTDPAVHPDQRFVGRAHGIGHEQLGHHHALEEVRRLADDDGVDIVEGRTAVGQRSVDGPRIRPFIDTSVRLATYLVCPVPSTAARVFAAHQASLPSSTATRFCCSTGPCVVCGEHAAPEPSKMCRAANPTRSSPVENIGLAASAPPRD